MPPRRVPRLLHHPIQRHPIHMHIKRTEKHANPHRRTLQKARFINHFHRPHHPIRPRNELIRPAGGRPFRVPEKVQHEQKVNQPHPPQGIRHPHRRRSKPRHDKGRHRAHHGNAENQAIAILDNFHNNRRNPTPPARLFQPSISSPAPNTVHSRLGAKCPKRLKSSVQRSFLPLFLSSHQD